MKDITNIEFRSGSKEERLPGFAPDFPYIASRAELDKYIGRFVPWHWHKTVELFYVESGVLEGKSYRILPLYLPDAVREYLASPQREYARTCMEGLL